MIFREKIRTGCHRFFSLSFYSSIIMNGSFITVWLTDWLTDCLRPPIPFQSEHTFSSSSTSFESSGSDWAGPTETLGREDFCRAIHTTTIEPELRERERQIEGNSKIVFQWPSPFDFKDNVFFKVVYKCHLGEGAQLYQWLSENRWNWPWGDIYASWISDMWITLCICTYINNFIKDCRLTLNSTTPSEHGINSEALSVLYLVVHVLSFTSIAWPWG